MLNKLIVLAICVLLSIGFITLPMGCIFDCGIFWEDPPLPEIKYGEFPFRIEYEINGERFVIEDTVICEFDGISSSENGKVLKWKSRLASGSEGSGMTLQTIDSTKRVTFSAGEPRYYMGDSRMSPEEYWHYNLGAVLVEGSGSSIVVLFPEQWYDEYNFKFISWKFTDPIVNTFK